MIEFLLASIGNLKIAFGILGCISFCMACICFGEAKNAQDDYKRAVDELQSQSRINHGDGSYVSRLRENAERLKEKYDHQDSILSKYAGGCIIFGLLACVPTMDDLWKVRIGIVKYRLASTENLTKASETIERIGLKLECKYLGCDDDKAKK